MSSILNTVDQRTNLVGENRLELLMFKLGRSQLFALNVFKIQEVLKVPKLTEVPKSHPCIRGVAHLRGQTIPVIDLRQAIGRSPQPINESANIIVTEYNRSVQAFLVNDVDRIVNLTWDQILPPPKGTGKNHYLTAITQVDERMVEILDVERILADIIPYNTTVSDDVLKAELREHASKMKLLLVDDSLTAIHQAEETIKQVGVEVVTARDGKLGLEYLKNMADSGLDVNKELLMVITDAEMPEMDGYTLTTEIRHDPRLKDLFVALHTSLSGSFNEAMVEKVGCDGFLSKFSPDELAELVQKQVELRIEANA